MERKTLIPFGESTDFSIDYLLGILEDARVVTLNRITDLPKEMLHWQYQEGWNTIGVLLSHIIACEHYFRIEFVEGRSLTKKENNAYLPGVEMGEHIPKLITNQGVEEYIAQLAESRSKLLAQIHKLDTEEFHKKREGYHPETGFNLAWALYHLAEDEVHHRGQISILKKLYETFYPPIEEESSDSD